MMAYTSHKLAQISCRQQEQIWTAEGALPPAPTYWGIH